MFPLVSLFLALETRSRSTLPEPPGCSHLVLGVACFCNPFAPGYRFVIIRQCGYKKRPRPGGGCVSEAPPGQLKLGASKAHLLPRARTAGCPPPRYFSPDSPRSVQNLGWRPTALQSHFAASGGLFNNTSRFRHKGPLEVAEQPEVPLHKGHGHGRLKQEGNSGWSCGPRKYLPKALWSWALHQQGLRTGPAPKHKSGSHSHPWGTAYSITQ